MREATRTPEGLVVVPLPHPQGCRTYLVGDPASKEALVVDPHLDGVSDLVREGAGRGWRLRWIVDTHTHADHPSGAAALASGNAATRVAHARAGHAGVTHFPDDDEPLALGDRALVVRHAPGHTSDHLVLVAPGALFSGDSLLLGAVARADFLGGDAGALFDSLERVVGPLADDTTVFPGHDYAGRVSGRLGEERRTNPWLALPDRDAFVRALEANRPPRPANMAALLRWNREGRALPVSVDAAEVVAIVRSGGAGSIIDVRTDPEVEGAHVPGSRHVVLDELPDRVREILETPAPRLLLCHVGQRAELARRWLSAQGVSGLQTVEGGIAAYAAAGGPLAGGRPRISASGGCGAAAPPTGGGCAAAPPSFSDDDHENRLKPKGPAAR